eukprot:g29239.t1
MLMAVGSSRSADGTPWLPELLAEEDLPTEPYTTEPKPQVEVVASTRSFRQLAKCRPHAGDRILEIGCCFGQCTELLAAGAAECVALTAQRLSEAEVAVARSLRLDILAHPEYLRTIASCQPPFTVVFADIGGNRELAHVLQLFRLLFAHMAELRYLAVKSEALAMELSKAPLDPQKRLAWWQQLCCPPARLAKAPRRMQQILQRPIQKTPHGLEICRFANYGVCSKGNDCRYDHQHCHRCLRPGHWATSCDQPEVEVSSEETYSQCSEVAERLHAALRAGRKELRAEKSCEETPGSAWWVAEAGRREVGPLYRNENYDTHTREVWFLHALESYFDLLALPFALALLLAPWRCTSLHTEDLKRTLSHRNTCGEQLSAIRDWAFCLASLMDFLLFPVGLVLGLTVYRAGPLLKALWGYDELGEPILEEKVVALQFLELLRDMLAFVALLILAVTLVRLPKVLLDIYAQRARPATGTPRLALRSVQKRLLQLDGDMTMCVQIEHRAPDGTEEVMGRLPIPARVLHDAIRRPETVVQEFAKKALRCSSLQDAVASYWPGLILGANLQLLEETINPHQHAFALEKIRTAHLRAEQLIVQLLAELEHWDFEHEAAISKEARKVSSSTNIRFRALVRASICAVLIPAWGLTPLPHWLRIILWLGLCSLPWLLTLQRAVIIFGALEVVLFTINLLRKGCQTCQAPSAYLNAMRMTGINGLVLVFVVGEGVMLASVEYLEPLFMNWTWFIVAACVGVLWLIVMSLPHAMSSSIKSCVDAVKFHMAIQLLRRCCLLPAAVVFLSQMDPQAQDATSRAAGMLLAFLSFTAVLGWDLLCQEHLPENLGLDLVQPPAFLAGLFFAQVAFDRLAQKGAQLEAATLVETKGEDLSPEEGAMQLEVLEKGTRMEYLSKSFFGRRVPTAIWQIILEFVSDVKYMSKMLNPVVQNFNSGGPDRQLMRAWELMNGEP